MPTKPEILKRRSVIESRLFQVEELHLQFSNGQQRIYERLGRRGDGAVLVVPVLNDDTLLLIREYGAGIDDYHLSLPKGAVDPGESILEAANRELMEEVGFGARQLVHLKRLTLSPGYMEHDIHIVLARDLFPQRLEGDEPEPIEVVPCPMTQLSELVTREDVTEGRAIAAMYMAQSWLSNHL